MTTHVQRAVTEVFTVPEPEREEGEEKSAWEEEARYREKVKRMQRIELRTRAEGMDD